MTTRSATASEALRQLVEKPTTAGLFDDLTLGRLTSEQVTRWLEGALRDAGWALVRLDSLDAGLICAVCWFVKKGVANPAVTVIEGYAVCEDHQGYVAQGQSFASIVNAAKREDT